MNPLARTAKVRKKLSGPMEYLNKHGLISSVALDYGCGRGDDAEILALSKYDPFWYPSHERLVKGLYDTVTCNYVLNVLPADKDREKVVEMVRSLLDVGGKAYISVRRDKDWLAGGKYIKGKGQAYVVLNEKVLYENSKFCIYVLEK